MVIVPFTYVEKKMLLQLTLILFKSILHRRSGKCSNLLPINILWLLFSIPTHVQVDR